MPRLLILEVLIHHLDTLRYLVGPLRVTAARTARVSSDLVGEDVAQIVLESDNGAFGTVVGNLSAPGYPPLPSDRLELVETSASVLFEDNVVTLKGETEGKRRGDAMADFS
jgi:predicted dehydrogenase